MNKSLTLMTFALAAAFAAPAQAALLQGPTYIAASTSVPTCEPAICMGLGANINEVADGNTADSGLLNQQTAKVATAAAVCGSST